MPQPLLNVRSLAALLVPLLVAWAAVLSPARAQTTPASPGPQDIRVTGEVRNPVSLDLAALQALPVSSTRVGNKTYTGTSLWAVLASAGLALDATRRSPGVSMFVVATGEDGYKAVFSLAEIDPAIGNRLVLVAYSADGSPLGEGGVARLVVVHDLKPSRAVFRLVELRVDSAR